jgi:hypothetical protein
MVLTRAQRIGVPRGGRPRSRLELAAWRSTWCGLRYDYPYRHPVSCLRLQLYSDRGRGWCHATQAEMEHREEMGATHFGTAYALRYGVALEPTMYGYPTLAALLDSPLLCGVASVSTEGAEGPKARTIARPASAAEAEAAAKFGHDSVAVTLRFSYLAQRPLGSGGLSHHSQSSAVQALLAALPECSALQLLDLSDNGFDVISRRLLRSSVTCTSQPQLEIRFTGFAGSAAPNNVQPSRRASAAAGSAGTVAGGAGEPMLMVVGGFDGAVRSPLSTCEGEGEGCWHVGCLLDLVSI